MNFLKKLILCHPVLLIGLSSRIEFALYRRYIGGVAFINALFIIVLIISYFIKRTIPSIELVSLCWLLSFAYVRGIKILLMFDRARMMGNIFKQVIEPNPNTKFIEKSLENYITDLSPDCASEDSLLHFPKTISTRRLGMFNLGRHEVPSVRIIYHTTDDGPGPSPYFTYNSAENTSFVFTSVAPSEIVGIRKFFIFHELGHTVLAHSLRDTLFYRTMTQFIVFCLVFIVIWDSNHINAIDIQIVLGGLLFIAILMRRLFFRVNREELADLFAIINTKTVILDKLKVKLRKHKSFLHDKTLGSFDRSYHRAARNRDNFIQMTVKRLRRKGIDPSLFIQTITTLNKPLNNISLSEGWFNRRRRVFLRLSIHRKGKDRDEFVRDAKRIASWVNVRGTGIACLVGIIVIWKLLFIAMRIDRVNIELIFVSAFALTLLEQYVRIRMISITKAVNKRIDTIQPLYGSNAMSLEQP